MKLAIYVYVLACLMNLAACKKAGNDLTPVGQVGFATGKALDAQGNPIKGAEIVANNTGSYSNNIVGYTDANGNYKLKLSAGPLVGSYYVRGTLKVKYDNKNYTLPLFTEEDGAFDPETGAVKNLRLKLSGERTGNFGDDGYYGGHVEVSNWTQDVDLADVELTFKPSGALIDGSTGKTLTTKLTNYYVDDIPLGKYTITARQVSTKRPLTIRVRDKNQEYTQSTIGTFEPTYDNAQHFRLLLDISDL
ncbi:hypothetical protein GCM10028807_10160 [Spirosoma daeguense]